MACPELHFWCNACASSAFVAVYSPACMGAGRWWWACGWLGRCMAPVAAELPPTAWSGSLRAQVPHTARWLLAAGGCRSIRCNGGADWAPSRRLTIPVLIGRDFFCRRFTFSKVPHSIPTHQTTDHSVPDHYTLVPPPAIPIPPPDRLSPQLQPGISSLQPNPTLEASQTSNRTPCVKLCTLTLLRHPHRRCITPRPPL